MARRSRPSTNLLVRLRAWFGLDQEALALYLGASPGLIRSVETGRRALTADLFLALRPLVQHLAPAEAAAALPLAALPPGAPAPDAAELDFRRWVCEQQAAKLGRELAAIEGRARVAARWAQALPALLQAAAETYATPDPANPDRGAWLAGWLTRQARPLPPEAVTRWHLLRARRAALLAEVAALEGGGGLPQA
ncbi:hypothetical protein [Hymenobacter terricola]|uniref:hypothetical protein n=1 Tax=Hymenobacter terricola TaxID=2819236 RepID=UPI001B306059|nr:hypothetical protein [Hymenobacter terricola]